MLPDDIRRSLLDFTVELRRKQNRNGAWPSKELTLESVVTTCQAVLMLAEVRGPFASVAAAAGVKWLSQSPASDYEYAYWRLLPLIRAEAPEQAVEDARGHLERMIRTDFRHHVNSPIEAFYVQCSAALGALDDSAVALLDRWEDELRSPPPDWSADRLAHTLAAYLSAGRTLPGAAISSVLNRIRDLSELVDGFRRWSSLVGSSYVLLNLGFIRSCLGDPQLRRQAGRLVQEGTTYVAEAWRRSAFTSKLPAGGDFSTELYNRIVVARALAAVASQDDVYWRERLWAEKYRRTHVWALVASITTLTLALTFVLTQSAPWLVAAQEIVPGLPTSAWQTLDRLATILSVLAFLFLLAPLVRRLWRYRTYLRGLSGR